MEHWGRGNSALFFAMANLIPLNMCIRLADGDPGAGVLLFTVQYWAQVAERSTYQDNWGVHTRQEWMAHCGLSRHRYDRALKLLRELGLIEVKHGVHRYRTGKIKATWMRPKLSVVADNQLSGPADNYLSGGADDVLYISKLQQSTEGAEPMKPPKEIEKSKQALGFSGVQAMLTQDEPSLEVKTVDGLYAVWKYGNATAYPGAYKQSWGKTQRAWAKQLIAKVPKEYLGPAMLGALLSWEDFTEWMQCNTSVTKTPDQPDLLFLLKFPEGMVNFWQDKKLDTEQKNVTKSIYAKGEKVLK